MNLLTARNLLLTFPLDTDKPRYEGMPSVWSWLTSGTATTDRRS